MKTLVIVVLLTAVAMAVAQPPDALWSREYGGTDHDHFRAVQQTTDGGYIAAGHTRSFGAGDWDVYLVKTNNVGDTMWTRTYGGTYIDQAFSVQQTSDGGYIVAGRTKSFGETFRGVLDPPVQYNIYVIKTTSTGDTIWTRTYGGTLRDEAMAIRQTSDGGYVIAGYTQSFGAGSFDVYLIKIFSNGNVDWTHTYGGNDEDQGYSVEQTADLGYIIAGYTKSYGAGMSDLYLIKTNNSGDTSWTRTYGGTNNDEAYDVEIALDGGYAIAGYTASFGAGSGDFYLVKTDNMGTLQWSNTYGGSADDRAFSLSLVPHECGYILVGYAWSNSAGEEDVYIVRTTCDGEICWTRMFGGASNDAGFGVGAAADSTYIIAGYKYSGPGPSKAYLIKLEPEPDVCPCDFPFTEFDMGDLQACNYPTLIGNPAHALTDVAWLGETITGEGVPNILDLDGGDDGVEYHNLPWMPCEEVSVTVTVTAGANYDNYALFCQGSLYLNGWKDGNIDGDFCDTLCLVPGAAGAPEWIVQDQLVTPGAHTFYFIDPGVLDMGIYDGVFRWRLTGEPVGPLGFGQYDPNACPDMCGGIHSLDMVGEVEDYIIDNAQLPVELTSFEALPGDDQITVRWTTASETDNDHFILYRRVTGDLEFNMRTQVQGSGTTSQSQEYEFIDRSVVNGITYEYQLADVDINGVESLHNTIVSATPEFGATIPTEYALHQNYPNPFNSNTMIRFDIKENGKVTLIVFNLLGQEVATLVDNEISAGTHAISWDASGLPSGIYLYKLEAGDFRAVKKLLFLK